MLPKAEEKITCVERQSHSAAPWILEMIAITIPAVQQQAGDAAARSYGRWNTHSKKTIIH